MRYISLFAGIGGFDLALNRLGHECVYVNEWDKYAAQTYEKNFCTDKERQGQAQLDGGDNPNTTSRGRIGKPNVDTRSITTVPTSEIPDHDLLVGGFPCQAFSIAGKRRGFDDTRGTLFFDIARILADKRPRHFILENVKGLLSHDGGKTFSTIFGVLTDLGYEYQWQVLNSKNFGVPQNRERVFIVGHLRGEPRPKVFPIRKDDSVDNGQSREKLQSPIVNTLTSSFRGSPDGANRPGFLYKSVANALDANYAKGDNRPNNKSGRTKVMTGYRIRRLTPMECERLQGFPDGWTEGVSDTQRYKQLGNAVTVNVVYEVARKLYES